MKPDKEAIKTRVIEEREKGLSMGQIAKELNISKSLVQRYLEEEKEGNSLISWEYLVKTLRDQNDLLEKELNSYGAEGWELINMFQYGYDYVNCTFKRIRRG